MIVLAHRKSRARRMALWTILLGVGAAFWLANPSQAADAGARYQANHFRFVAYGDTRSDAAAHSQVIALIISMHPEFALQTGDLVNFGNYQPEWTEFQQITAPLRAAHIGYFPARGNHDIGPYYIHFVPPWQTGNGYYYAFTKHYIRFIAVDCFEDFSPKSAQYRWLDAQLAAATAKGEPCIVYFHEPPFSIGIHGDNMDVQKTLHPLFVRYHVPLVFCGHDHLYYRTRRDGVTYVVTGGGGAPLYPFKNIQNAIPGDVYKSVHHAVRCVVNGKTIHLTAITPDNEVIDDFTVALK